jgi:hypothetical protein
MNTYTMKEIKSREGYYLTQVEEVGENRIFITAIKGVNINESDWREATQEEKDEFENTEKETEEEKTDTF